MSEILPKLKLTISQVLGVKQEDIKLNSRLIEDLDADSLDVVELSMCVADDFNIEIPDEDAEGLKTVGQYLDYLVARNV